MAETTIVLTADAFSLAPDRAELFRWLKCPEDLPAHRAFLEARDEARACFERLCAPLCLAHLTPEGQATVFLTAGAALEAEVDRCFARGACAQAALLNLMADQALFEMDGQAAKLLETRLAAQGLYIAARREAPIDFPLALQRRLFAPLAPSAPGISVTEAGVFRPVKSMLFCLDTTPTPCHGQAAHDCSRCRMQHCPYRRLRTQSIGSSTHNQTEDRRP